MLRYMTDINRLVNTEAVRIAFQEMFRWDDNTINHWFYCYRSALTNPVVAHFGEAGVIQLALRIRRSKAILLSEKDFYSLQTDLHNAFPYPNYCLDSANSIPWDEVRSKMELALTKYDLQVCDIETRSEQDYHDS